jgi:pimeloyl-ACP methyl ester carboxylesterase
VTTVHLTHVRTRLALHELRGGEGRALLLLHGLGERTPASVPDEVAAWPGPVYGLDLSGHGASSRAPGGGYTAEVLMADVDVALAHLGTATVVGRGLGAYVALLIAGARPLLVRGAVLCDGPGLAGGGPAPVSPSVASPAALEVGPDDPDPYALVELARDVRPEDYAVRYLGQALELSGLDVPVAVAAVVRPPWLAAVAAEPGVAVEPVAVALARYAAVT